MSTAAEKFKQRNKGRGASDVLSDWKQPPRLFPQDGQPAMKQRIPRAARPFRVNTYLTTQEGQWLDALTAKFRDTERNRKIGHNIVIGRALKLLAQQEGL